MRLHIPEGWDQLVDRIVDDAGNRAVVLLDGGSGAGKSTLAAQLAITLMPRLGKMQLITMDELYAGWEGLAAGSRILADDVLDPDAPGYRRWDWELGRRDNRVHLDPKRPLLVEGCGALTTVTARKATTSLWLELDAVSRRRRALDRDGELFHPWWERWAAQEQEHWRVNAPQQLADLVLTGQTTD